MSASALTTALTLVCLFFSKCSYYIDHLFLDAAKVPVVCVVVNGGPNTLKTVRSAIEKGTPAIIVEVL